MKIGELGDEAGVAAKVKVAGGVELLGVIVPVKVRAMVLNELSLLVLWLVGARSMTSVYVAGVIVELNPTVGPDRLPPGPNCVKLLKFERLKSPAPDMIVKFPFSKSW